MIRVIKFEPEHVLGVNLQPMQAEALPEISLEYGKELAGRGPAVTGLIDGRVLFCGGKAKLSERRWYCWALLSKEAGRYMTAVTHIAKRLLETQRGDGELCALVRSDFAQAQRWIQMLGFDRHRSVEIDGLPCDVYIKVH